MCVCVARPPSYLLHIIIGVFRGVVKAAYRWHPNNGHKTQTDVRTKGGKSIHNSSVDIFVKVKVKMRVWFWILHMRIAQVDIMF